MTSNNINLTTLLDKFPAGTTTKEKLLAASALLETMRIFSRLGPDMLYSATEYVAESAMNIDCVDFSVTKKLLAYKNPAVALEALVVFSELIESDPANASEVLLESLLEEIEDRQPLPAPLPKPVAKNVELYTERMLSRVFQPAVFSSQLARTIGADLVTVRGTLASGELGPALRGLAFDGGINVWSTILETGEYLQIPMGESRFALKVTADADDYANVCPALLVFMTQLRRFLHTAGVLNDAQAAAPLWDGCLGTYSCRLHVCEASKDTVKSLTQVLDYACDNDNSTAMFTGPAGASVRFAVPDTDMTVVLDACPSNTGPYIVARLMRGETILMRLDHPRYFSARGVYFFPLSDCAVFLTVMY